MTAQKIVSECKKNFKIQQITSEIEEFVEILQKLNINIAVEIGCANGGTAYCIKRAIGEKSKLISIDPRKPPKKNLQLIREHGPFTFFHGYSTKLRHRVKEELKGEKIDLLFIDGNHTYGGVKKDFKRYLGLMSENGIIALHDIVDSPKSRKQNCHVYKFWEELKKEYKTVEIVKTKKWAGIGIVILNEELKLEQSDQI